MLVVGSNPFVNMLGCTSPDELRTPTAVDNYARDGYIRGGFFEKPLCTDVTISNPTNLSYLVGGKSPSNIILY